MFTVATAKIQQNITSEKSNHPACGNCRCTLTCFKTETSNLLNTPFIFSNEVPFSLHNCSTILVKYQQQDYDPTHPKWNTSSYQLYHLFSALSAKAIVFFFVFFSSLFCYHNTWKILLIMSTLLFKCCFRPSF